MSTDPTAAARKRELNAKYQRDWRLRDKIGRVTLTIEVDEHAMAQALMDAGELSEDDSRIPEKVAAAIERQHPDWELTVRRYSSTTLPPPKMRP